jgi:hypothetical protein
MFLVTNNDVKAKFKHIRGTREHNWPWLILIKPQIIRRSYFFSRPDGQPTKLLTRYVGSTKPGPTGIFFTVLVIGALVRPVRLADGIRTIAE